MMKYTGGTTFSGKGIGVTAIFSNSVDSSFARFDADGEEGPSSALRFPSRNKKCQLCILYTHIWHIATLTLFLGHIDEGWTGRNAR